ncbi:MAG: heat-inducible transcriptional repressor HrcA [Myxococcota bacterium]
MGHREFERDEAQLGERQRMVLRAMITAYVGEASPVGSATLSHLLPVALSSASIRNTMAELTSLGFVDQPHASAGRVPTERGLRLFVDELVDPRDLGAYEKRDLAGTLEDTGGGALMRAASQILSDRTRQLGFVVVPRLRRVVLRRVSLVRLTSHRLLVVLVTESGAASQRVVADDGSADQSELERMATLLNERISGHTLEEIRDWLAGEARQLRTQADRLLGRAVAVASRAMAAEPDSDPDGLVVASWLALLEQPEFHDLDRIRQLLEAVETQERLLAILDEMLAAGGVRVAFGEEVGEPSLRHCALVAAPYGGERAPLGVLGVIGPRRMDYARVIPLVGFLSTLVTERIAE